MDEPVRVIVGERDGPTETLAVEKSRYSTVSETVRGLAPVCALLGLSIQRVNQIERTALGKLGRAVDELARDPALYRMASQMCEGGLPADWRADAHAEARAMVRAELVAERGEIEGNAEADRCEAERRRRLTNGAA